MDYDFIFDIEFVIFIFDGIFLLIFMYIRFDIYKFKFMFFV